VLYLVHVAWQLFIILTKHRFHSLSVVLIEQSYIIIYHLLVLWVILLLSLSSDHLLLQEDVTEIDLIVYPLY
jgi:hypothetical protein